MWYRVFCRSADELKPAEVLDRLRSHTPLVTARFKGDDLGWSTAEFTLGTGTPVYVERYLTGEEITDLLHYADDALDPARVVHARIEVAALERAMEELTERQRAILIAARVEDLPQQEIASRFRISVRMVGKELKRALEHCGQRLDRRVVQRFGPGAGKAS